MPEEATSQPPRADYIRGGGGQKEADEKGWNPFGKKALANKGAGGATKASPQSSGFFSKAKELWDDLTD